MNLKHFAAFAILLAFAGYCSAHRLDEYLQATILSVDKDHVQGSIRLVPGVAVASAVLASIDTNSDGAVSGAEQHAYALRVLADTSLNVDATRLRPSLVSVKFPEIDDIKAGLGTIHIEFTAALPPGGFNRRLVFENHHQRRLAAYLVNCLVPRDPAIRIVAQNRNTTQSHYQLDYTQNGTRAAAAR
jgi:hypothetical protein